MAGYCMARLFVCVCVCFWTKCRSITTKKNEVHMPAVSAEQARHGIPITVHSIVTRGNRGIFSGRDSSLFFQLVLFYLFCSGE